MLNICKSSPELILDQWRGEEEQDIMLKFSEEVQASGKPAGKASCSVFRLYTAHAIFSHAQKEKKWNCPNQLWPCTIPVY